MPSVNRVTFFEICDFAVSSLLYQDDGFSHTGICAGGKHMGDDRIDIIPVGAGWTRQNDRNAPCREAGGNGGDASHKAV